MTLGGGRTALAQAPEGAYAVGADTDVPPGDPYIIPPDTDIGIPIVGPPGEGDSLLLEEASVFIIHPPVVHRTPPLTDILDSAPLLCARSKAPDYDQGATLVAVGYPGPGWYEWSCSGWSAGGRDLTDPVWWSSDPALQYIASVTYTPDELPAVDDSSGYIHVYDADLYLEGLEDDVDDLVEHEEGAFLAKGSARVPLWLDLFPADPDSVYPSSFVHGFLPIWQRPYPPYTVGLGGGACVRFYSQATGGQPLTDLTWGWEFGLGPPPGYRETLPPAVVYVEPYAAGTCEISLGLQYNGASFSPGSSLTTGDSVKVTVVDLNLNIDGVPDGPQEEDPGGFVGVGQQKMLTLSVTPTALRPIRLEVVGGKDKVEILDEGGVRKDVDGVVTFGEQDPVPLHLFVNGVKHSDGLRDVEIKLSYTTPQSEVISDTVKFTVVGVDLCVDGVDEDHEMDPGPGAFVRLNTDDDNENDIVDKNEAPNPKEDDLAGMTLRVYPDGIDGNVSLAATAGSAKVKAWQTKTKDGGEVVLPPDPAWTVAEMPTELYLEGYDGSGTPRDVELALSYSGHGTTAEDRVKVTVTALNLKSVTFAEDPLADPVNYYDVAVDTTGLAYPKAHWLDANGDGDAKDQGDNDSPVCYIGNTKMVATVTITVAPAAAYGDVVKIKGDGLGNLHFPETVAAVANGEATITDVKCDNAFENVVKCYYTPDVPLDITWSISRNSGASWITAPMHSKNDAFITLDRPACTPPFRTVLYLATKNGGDSPGSCVTNTWNMFAGPANVQGWNEATRRYNRLLYYYRTADGDDVRTAAGLLGNTDANHGSQGQCSAWADMLQHCFLANNVRSSAITLVRPPLGYTQLGVKNIHLDDSNPTYPTGYGPWMYAVNTPSDDLDCYPPPEDAGGIPGQNTPTPAAKLFVLHYIVCNSGTYYDPSYGVTSQSAHEYTLAAVDAWASLFAGVEHWCKAASQPDADLRFTP